MRHRVHYLSRKAKALLGKAMKVILAIISACCGFWNYYHPCNDLRLLSVDQKPTWINHVGHKGTLATGGCTQLPLKENFNPTRERYTIITSIKVHDDRFPKIAIVLQGRRPCDKMGRPPRKAPAATTEMATLWLATELQ